VNCKKLAVYTCNMQCCMTCLCSFASEFHLHDVHSHTCSRPWRLHGVVFGHASVRMDQYPRIIFTTSVRMDQYPRIIFTTSSSLHHLHYIIVTTSSSLHRPTQPHVFCCSVRCIGRVLIVPSPSWCIGLVLIVPSPSWCIGLVLIVPSPIAGSQNH
jgi:hypothetical protein